MAGVLIEFGVYDEHEVMFDLRKGSGIHVTLADGNDPWTSMLKPLDTRTLESPYAVQEIRRTYSLSVAGQANTSDKIHTWTWVAHYYWSQGSSLVLRKATIVVARINKAEYRLEVTWGKDDAHILQLVLDSGTARVLEKLFRTTRNYM
jgi:hypothetical protein